MNRFDFVVGNPPWLTYAAVSNGEYQHMLRQLSDAYDVTPASKANMPHLEIAAIFLAHAVNYFLKLGGRLAFVMPRSFMSADQHDNTRGGVVKGVKLTGAWDLEGVSPLFRVPCCALFATRTNEGQLHRQIPKSGIPGLAFSGRLPRSQIHWDEAEDKLTVEPRRWHYSRLQGGRGAARSALTAQAMDSLVGTNAYAARFSQGATIVPRNFFFVEVDQPVQRGENIRDRVVSLRTADGADREAKAPWKGQLLSGRAEGQLLYRTAISRNILPFALVDPLLVVLPVVIDKDADGRQQFKMLSAEGLLEKGFRHGSAWFFEAERRWAEHQTDKNRQMGTTLSAYLNWQNKLTEQNTEARYLVLYTSSATDASAVVVDRRTFDHPFVVDHKAYWCECRSEAEAHYLSAYVNSGYANGKIKEFQSRGLFGPRDIHKLIVKLPFPKYGKDQPQHEGLSALGRQCAELSMNFTRTAMIDDLQARALGTLRSRLKEEMASQLSQIDEIVELLSTEKSDSYREAKKKTGRSNAAARLFD